MSGVLRYTGLFWFVFSHNQATVGASRSLSQAVKVLIKSRAGGVIPALCEY